MEYSSCQSLTAPWRVTIAMTPSRVQLSHDGLAPQPPQTQCFDYGQNIRQDSGNALLAHAIGMRNSECRALAFKVANAGDGAHVTAVRALTHRPMGRSRLPENFRASPSCHSANTTTATAINLARLPTPAPRDCLTCCFFSPSFLTPF